MALQELKFTEKTHKYETVGDPNKKWTSVTGLVGKFKPPFDQAGIALKCSKSKKSKWFGMTPEEIIQVWKNETDRALRLGTWYHNDRETDLLSCETIGREGLDLPVHAPIEQDGLKYSPDQAVIPCIYPEHFVYLKSAGLCGQADRVEVVGDRVDVL